MSVSDKVNIQLEVTGGVVSAQEIDRVNKGLQQMGVDATTAAEVGKKLSQNNKDVKEGLQALALAAAQVSPAAGEAVRGLSALKLAQQGVMGVATNLGAAMSAVWSAITSPIAIVVAALGSILALYHQISAATKQWEENQRRAGEEAQKARDALTGKQNERQGAARGEARDIIRAIGGMGGEATSQNIEDIQRRARLLQEAVPTATSEQAMKAATASIIGKVDFNTAWKGLAAQSFGTGVEVPAGIMPAGDAARASLEASANRLTPSQIRSVIAARATAPVNPDGSLIGAFDENSEAELARRRQEANAAMMEAQAGRAIPSSFFQGTYEVGQAESVSNRQAASARAIINNNNCIINNRPGEPTGILGPPSDSTIPIP